MPDADGNYTLEEITGGVNGAKSLDELIERGDPTLPGEARGSVPEYLLGKAQEAGTAVKGALQEHVGSHMARGIRNIAGTTPEERSPSGNINRLQGPNYAAPWNAPLEKGLETLTGQPTDEYHPANESLRRSVGPVAAESLKAGAGFVAENAPQLLVPGGFAAKGEGVVAKLAAGAKTGGGFGLMHGMTTKGANPLETTVEGAAFGAGLEGLKIGGHVILNAVKALPKVFTPKVGPKPPADFAPHAMTLMSDETGPVAVFHELKAPSGETPAHVLNHAMPVATARQRVQVQKFVKRHKIDLEAIADMSTSHPAVLEEMTGSDMDGPGADREERVMRTAQELEAQLNREGPGSYDPENAFRKAERQEKAAEAVEGPTQSMMDDTPQLRGNPASVQPRENLEAAVMDPQERQWQVLAMAERLQANVAPTGSRTSGPGAETVSRPFTPEVRNSGRDIIPNELRGTSPGTAGDRQRISGSAPVAPEVAPEKFYEKFKSDPSNVKNVLGSSEDYTNPNFRPPWIEKGLGPGAMGRNQNLTPLPASPTPAPTPQNVSPKLLQDFHAQEAMLTEATRKKRSWLMENILLPAQKVGIDVAGQVREYNAAKKLQSSDEAAIFKSMWKASGRPDLETPFDKDLLMVFEGTKPIADLDKYGGPWQAVKTMFETMAAERSNNDMKLNQMGVVPDEKIAQRQAGSIPDYAARFYLAKTNPKAWAKYVKSEPKLFDDAVEFLLSKEPHADVNRVTKIRDSLHQMMGEEDSVGAMAGSDLGNGAFQNLKKREDFPLPLRKLMGESASGLSGIAKTISAQRSILSQLTIAADIARNPAWTRPEVEMGFGRKLPEWKSFGELAGKAVRDDIYDALINTPRTIQRADTIRQTLLGYQKINLIGLGGTGSIRHHVMGLLKGAGLSGGLSLTRPDQGGRALWTAIQAERSWREHPVAAGLMDEMRKLGVVEAGFGHEEIRGAERDMLDKLKKTIMKGKPQDLYSILGAVRGFGDTYMKAGAKASAVFDWTNNIVRGASYVNLVKKLTPKAQSFLDRLNAGEPMDKLRAESHGQLVELLQHMPPELAAKRMAAKKIQDSFVNYSQSSNFSQAVKNSNLAGVVFSPVFTTAAERFRVSAMLANRLKTEPELKWNMLREAMVMSAVYGGYKALQYHNGITDEEVAQAHAAVAGKTSQFHPGIFNEAWRDDYGRIQFTDHTGDWIGFELFKGSEVDPLFNKMATNGLLMGLGVEGGVGAEMIKGALEHFGALTPEKGFQLRPEDSGLINGLMHMNRSGALGPQVLSDIQDFGRRTGVARDLLPEGVQDALGMDKLPGKYSDPLTVPQGLSELLLGRREYPVGPNTMLGAHKGNKAEQGKAKAMRNEGYKRGNVGLSRAAEEKLNRLKEEQ